MAVEKRVFKNLKLFMENKKAGDDLFDRLNTTILNTYLNSLMDGLTAKASIPRVLLFFAFMFPYKPQNGKSDPSGGNF